MNSTGDTILGELEPQYFNIEAGIAKATNNDGLWEAELSSIININQETESAIHLVVSVNKLSEDRYQLENIKGFPKEQEIQLKKGESFYYNETVDGLSEGQYEASFKVISEQDKDYIWANQEQLLFTVTEDGVELDWRDDYIPSFAPSESQTSESKGTHSISPEIAPYIRHDSQEYIVAEEQLSDQASDNAIMATSTLTGNWKFYTKSGTKNIRNAKVELKYRDQFYIWRTVGTTYTNTLGNFSFSYTPPNANYWELIIYPQSTFTTVKNPNDGNAVWKSNMFYLDLTSGGNVNLTLTNGTSVNSAFYVYDDIVTHNSFLNLSGKDPGNAHNVIFNSSLDQGSYFSGGTVCLYKNTPGTSTPMHEMGHYYMYNLYGSIPSSPSCSNHTFQTATSTGCAWVEGWASIVPLIFNNGVYTYTGGSTISLENTSSFDNGDTVEGRVLGALWDLYDTSNDGTDTRSYDFSKIYRAMWDGGSKNTFAEIIPFLSS
ncbi:hypothetical protein FHR92_000630 [Fontibacillus solani]|uniref:Uncharacterized protein n=1 Tax=Fontibacillus solani TaxID=1572857 RepID=A0A7W3SQ64_9BACL|nr:hypothetical protein [Fontibacillus solani]MBA9084176.1 hypothetical protein [Fontibacillus solani]